MKFVEAFPMTVTGKIQKFLMRETYSIGGHIHTAISWRHFMGISFFKLLGPVMEREVTFVAERLTLSRDQVYEMILAEAQNNQSEWYSNRVPNLNYESPACRLAYLYIVAAANASTVLSVLESDIDLQNYVLDVARARHELKICAFGAGPGTELMAIAKFFERQQLDCSVSVDFHLLDKVQEWASSWYAIRDQVNSTFRESCGPNRSTWPLNPTGNFIACDVTDTERINSLGQIWHQDIYVINFLLSEIFTEDIGLLTFLGQVAGLAPQGARFIFIERRGPMWQRRMSAIAAQANLSLSPFISSEGHLSSFAENPSDMGEIYEGLKARRNPRLSWKVVYSVGIKQ